MAVEVVRKPHLPRRLREGSHGGRSSAIASFMDIQQGRHIPRPMVSEILVIVRMQGSHDQSQQDFTRKIIVRLYGYAFGYLGISCR